DTGSPTSARASQICLTATGDLGHRVLTLPRFLESLIDAEAGRLLPRRELLERLQELRDDGLRGHQQKRVICLPFVVEHAGVFGGPLERVTPKIVEMWSPHGDWRFEPHTETMCSLLHERGLPMADAQRKQLAVVAPVEESLASTLFDISP